MSAVFVSRTLLRARALFWRLVYRGARARYRIAPGFRFNGAAIQLYGDGEIELGDGSYIGELSTVQACTGHRVSVGRACRISHNVRIYTETSDADCDFRAGEDRVVRGDVRIGDGVWIGANALVAPGVAIGDNAVVGANSVVTADIPVGEIWGGVPARFIRAKRAPARP